MLIYNNHCYFHRTTSWITITLSSKRNFAITCCRLETHYDVLKIKNNSTAKEIRDAYIKLSKLNHPDRNPNDPTLHDRFVKLQEAYNVLSNVDSRKCYDISLSPPNYSQKQSYNTQTRDGYPRNFYKEYQKPPDIKNVHERMKYDRKYDPRYSNYDFRYQNRYRKMSQEEYDSLRGWKERQKKYEMFMNKYGKWVLIMFVSILFFNANAVHHQRMNRYNWYNDATSNYNKTNRLKDQMDEIKNNDNSYTAQDE